MNNYLLSIDPSIKILDLLYENIFITIVNVLIIVIVII